MMVAAAISEAVSSNSSRNPKNFVIDDNLKRSPLLLSKRDNGINPRKTKSRQVSSRYLSPSNSAPSVSTSLSSSSSRRLPSPLVSRNSTATLSTPVVLPKRSASVDRRRPFTVDLDPKLSNASEVSASSKMSVTSVRSLSVSFQGEAFSLPVSKTKVAPVSPNLSLLRKGTPERRTSTPSRGKFDSGGDQVENSKLLNQHRWPARSRQHNPLSNSLECNSEKNDMLIGGSGNVIRALQPSFNGDNLMLPLDSRLGLQLSNTELLKAVRQTSDGNLVDESFAPFDLATSDTDSVSSSSTSGLQECNRGLHGRSTPSDISVSARFWQETDGRLRRLQDPASLIPTSPGSKMGFSSKSILSKRFQGDSPLASPHTMASPVSGGVRSSSPSKIMSSVALLPSRGMISPSRVRYSFSGGTGGNCSEAPSVLSFAVDIRRSKMGESHLFDAHLLRLVYNRQLQWRFINARSEATLLVQKHIAEKNLWNAWITISYLRDTVTKRRYRLQLLQQKLKLASILMGLVVYLEDWALLDKQHSISLFGAIEALKASTLRLPVVGVIADIQNIKESISSAINVLQAMTSSICSLLSKVEEINYFVAELARIAGKERAQLEQCKDFLTMLAALQVKHCSLRTHNLQIYCVPST